jgi:hypothetical protein
MSERSYFEHYTTGEPIRLERRYCCECCGYPTLEVPNDLEFCPICDWMDDFGGCGGPGPETLTEARQNFRAYLTKYRPGSNGYQAQSSNRERTAKRELMQAYDAYMTDPDLRRRTELMSKVERLTHNFPNGDDEE